MGGIGVMGRAIAVLANSAAAGRPFTVLAQAIARLWREITRDAVRPYRPEQHYMRGPGPAWRAKHGLIDADHSGIGISRRPE
jgi:hypothetical protein